MKTFKNEGIRGLYQGIGAVLVGGVPGVVVYLMAYESSKDLLERSIPICHEYPAISYLCSGMIAEAACCSVFVPVDVIKERLQVQSNTHSSTTHYKGSLDALRTIVRSEGLRGIYKGYIATLLSYGPFSAVYFLLYEEVLHCFDYLLFDTSG